MQWFTLWWEGLTLAQQIFACAAVPATIILVLQTVLLLFGMGGHDADHGEIDDHSALDEHDADHDDALGGDGDDTDLNHDGAHQAQGIRLFTVRGLVAFFAVGGWTGVVLCGAGTPSLIAGLLAFAAGSAALFLVALVLKWLLSMQESGTLDLQNAVSQTGSVYLTIPPCRSGSGKITLTVQEQLVELEAVTDHPEPLKTGVLVRVTGLADDSTLVVKPLAKDSSPESENVFQ